MAELLDLLTDKQYLEMARTNWGKYIDKYEPSKRDIMAQVFENQRRLVQNLTPQRAALAESATDQTTTTFGVSIFPNSVVYPLIDQVFPRLIAMQLCDVRPMRTSVANLQFLTRKFSADDATFTHTGSKAAVDEGGTIAKGKLVWTSDTVSAVAYKLRAVYTRETVEDALRDGNVNFESMMIKALADEIMGEIDETVLADMFANAGNSASFSTTAHSYETVKEHQQELWDALVDASAAIYADMQTSPNFIVGDPVAIGRIEKLQQFQVTGGNPDDMFQVGAVRVGNLNNQYAVYKTTMAPANKLLVGVRGMAYAFCPYIPLELTPETYNGDVDEYARGVRTRFGKKMIHADALAVVTIS
jgi:hypothetical protein